jgi:hypothetical protein
MAHYAFMNSDNVVVKVMTGVDEDVIQYDQENNPVGGTSEAWEEFYEKQPWNSGLYCKRTSYNGRIRKQYAGIGFFYDSVNDVFITPQPYPSWTLDQNYDWQPPKPMPSEGFWIWDEEVGEWVEQEISVA